MTAKTIMIASGKGGTGKSTAAVFLGSALAARDKKVLVIELDSGLRSVDIISGVYGKTVYDIQDVLSGRCEGDKAVVQSPLYENLWVISAPYSGGEIPPGSLSVFCGKMKSFFDFILIDTAAGMGAAFQAAASVGEMALLVITPDPVALRDGRIVADELCEQPRREVRLLLNKVDGQLLKKSAVQDLDECIDTVGVQLIGVVPQSTEVQLAAAKGEMLPSGCLAAKAFHNIAARILGETAPLALY